MKNDLVANKKNAITFYHIACLGEPVQAISQYVGVEYIQHNPLAGNGKQVFIDYFDENGKIIEHWNALQTVPNETKNGNTIYYMSSCPKQSIESLKNGPKSERF